LIEGCWLEAGGAACTDERGLAAAAAFFDVLEGCDDGGDITDLAEVLRRVDALFVPPDPSADGRISLMTVHKSKGLQFDTVILPRLEARTRSTPPRLLEWMYRAHDTGMAFIMAPVSEQGAEKSPILSWMMNSIKRKDAHERVRALYVASTRARRRLHLSARVTLKEKDGVAQVARPIATSFLHALWAVYGDEVEGMALEWRVETEVEESRIVVPEQQLFRLPAAWTAPALPAAVQLAGDTTVTSLREDGDMHRAPFRASEAARAVGVTVHAALADIVRNGGVRWWMDMNEAARLERLRVYFALHAPGLDAEALLRDAADAVTGATNSDHGRWVLASHAEDVVEWELRAVLDGHVVGVVIDRSFVSEKGERWIIDYKTSTHEGGDLEAFLAAQEAAYQPQLHRYARIVRMLDQRPIHTALYFPKLGLLREV
jgi:ATP-dependent exoDNAse (exonuclease V) beta subunit